MIITSAAFQEGSMIPTKYAHFGVHGGQNISLPFHWADIPESTESLALSIIDPHHVANNWIHWFVINIPAISTGFSEGASRKSMPIGCMELLNSYGTRGYGGPEPPPGSGVHPYVVTLFALSVTTLSLREHTNLREFQSALDGKIINSVTLTGIYER